MAKVNRPRQFTAEQLARIEPLNYSNSPTEAIDGLRGMLVDHVLPHVGLPPRRGTKRSILIVGAGGRGGIEAVATALALGPGDLKVTDLDKGYIDAAQAFYNEIIDDLGPKPLVGGQKKRADLTPPELKRSTVTFGQQDVYAPYPEKHDIVLAFSIYPPLVNQGGKGMDNIINMAKENGGIVVFTKMSPTGKTDLETAIREREDAGVIKVLERANINFGQQNFYLADIYICVVQKGMQ